MATKNPDIGVTMAVAKILNVVLQAISSAVAAIDPCICGNIAEAINNVVEYKVDATTTAAMINARRANEYLATRGESSAVFDMAPSGTGQYRVGDFFRCHDGRNIGVGAGHDGENGRIDHP